MLRTGKGVQKNPKAAEDLMARAADAGLFTAQADLPTCCSRAKRAFPTQGRAALAPARGRERPPYGQFELGQLYEQGSVVPRTSKWRGSSTRTRQRAAWPRRPNGWRNCRRNRPAL